MAKINLNLLPLFRVPRPATRTPYKSTPLTFPTISFPPALAHERAISTLLKVLALASRSFFILFRIF